MVSGQRLRQPYNFKRGRALFVVMVIVWAIFIGRLFYLQVIRHDYYAARATQSHERKFEIPAKRGSVYAYDRDTATPLVLNENLPTVFADPRYIEDRAVTAAAVAEILGGSAETYFELLDTQSAFVVLKAKASNSIADKIEDAEIEGVGVQDAYYRAYPEVNTASHVLGFVNVDGQGQYGIEEYFDDKLAGIPGRVEAVTDAKGVPLRGEDSNIIDDPVDGRNHVLTIDVNLQKEVENLLEAEVKKSKATNASALVIDPNTGAVKAMANYPDFNPAKFSEVKDFSVFQNISVSYPYEAGSVIKVLTMAAGLNEGAVSATGTYYDKSWVQVDDAKIENAVQSPPQTRTMRDVIQKSLNTGVIHVLSELGGGSINSSARTLLHGYFAERFGLGTELGIELPSENSGILFGPNEGYGLNVRYANMTFGQGLTTTMLQIASAISSIANGGTFYQPHIISAVEDASGNLIEKDPVVLRNSVVSEKVAAELKNMMRLVVDEGGGRSAKKAGYRIGGKTGTAQLLDDDGTYSDDREIGSFVGFIEGGDGVEYVIISRVDEPQGYAYAGSGAAAPLFANIAHWLIDYDRIPPIDN